MYDDSNDVYREQDLDRLGEFSIVVPFSDREGLASVLQAA